MPMRQRVGFDEQAVEHVPAQIRQREGKDEQAVLTTQGHFKGMLTAGGVIHLTLTEGGEGLANDTTVRQTLLSEQNACKSMGSGGLRR